MLVEEHFFTNPERISDMITFAFSYVTVISKSSLSDISHPSQSKCVFAVTYIRWICSGHLCPAVMFCQDQLY